MNNEYIEMGIDEVIENEGFEIKDDNVADWAIEKVNEERAEVGRNVKVLTDKIDDIKRLIQRQNDSLERKTSFLSDALMFYFSGVEGKKETKTEIQYKLPSGKLAYKKAKQSFKIDREIAIAAVKGNKNLSEYVEEVKTDKLKWAELKKTLAIVDGDIVNKETGEVIEIEGLSIEDIEGQFYIK